MNQIGKPNINHYKNKGEIKTGQDEVTDIVEEFYSKYTSNNPKPS